MNKFGINQDICASVLLFCLFFFMFAMRGCADESYTMHAKEPSHNIIKKNGLNKHKDILDFLYMSDCGGEISSKTCGHILALIENIDFGDQRFQYASVSKNDYKDFKQFLKECVQKRRKMRWE